MDDSDSSDSSTDPIDKVPNRKPRKSLVLESATAVTAQASVQSSVAALPPQPRPAPPPPPPPPPPRPPPPRPSQAAPRPSAAPVQKQNGKGVCSCCCVMSSLLACISRCVLMVTNTFIMVLAILIAMIAYGLLYIGTPENIKAKLLEYGIEAEIGDIVNPYTYFFGYIGWFLVVMSAACCFTGCLGFCGALCAHKKMLQTYVGILNCVFTVMLITTVSVYWNKNIGKSRLLSTLKSYEGTGGGAISMVWTLTMIELECCGVDSYKDFQNLPNWPNKTLGLVDQITPIACCKTPKDAKQPTADCATKSGANDTNNYMNTGCYDVMFDAVFNNSYFLSLLFLLHVAMVVQLVFGWWVISNINNSNMKGGFNAKQWGKSALGRGRMF